jgi:hypothetical protein
MNIIYKTYSESEHAVVRLILYYNKNYLDCVQNYKSSFYHKEEMIIYAFNTRVTALFYHLLPAGVHVDKYD